MSVWEHHNRARYSHKTSQGSPCSNWAWSDPWLLNTDENVNVSSSLVSEHIARWSGGNVHLFRFMFTRPCLKSG